MQKSHIILAFEPIFNLFATKKVLIRTIYMFAFVILIGATMSSCRAKEGCAVNEQAHVQTKKNGKKKGKTKSNLFSKKVRKKL